MKYAEDHLTVDCPRKARFNNVKCVLCRGNHPVNFKGCTIYKDLLKNKYPALRSKDIKYVSAEKYPTNTKSKGTINGLTYAQVTREGTRKEDQEIIPLANTGHNCTALQQSNVIY